jgi:hypothetical protein
MVFALAAGVWVFWWLNKQGNQDPEPEPERVCSRCKLRTVGKPTRDYLYCPFCSAKYPSLL